MNIADLLHENPELNITIKVADLIQFGETIADKIKEVCPNKNEDKIYTRSEVTKKFNICSATLWRWDKMGLITGKKIGNRKYYPESEIKRLSEKNRGDI